MYTEGIYEGALKSSWPKNEKKEIIISKLFLFFNIISFKVNTFIPAMLQHHYPVPVVVLCKICKIPLYSWNRLLIRRKTLTSEKEFEFWEEIEVRGSQIWGIRVGIESQQNKLCCDPLNPLHTNRRLLYLKTQYVPRCKHFSSGL